MWSYYSQLLALGNQIGKITIWDMTTEDAVKSKYVYSIMTAIMIL